MPLALTLKLNGTGVKVQSSRRYDQVVTVRLPDGSLSTGAEVALIWNGGQISLTGQ